jgi:branched-chain amino acid transport system ATP-binding protein
MRDRVREAGAEVVLVDVGVLGEPQVTADVSREEVAEAAAAGIGFVPQGRRLFPSLSVEEHLKLVAGRGNGKRWTPKGIYELFPRLEERRKNGAAGLSGGEQQMLAIARALLINPKLLIMDEPSEGLAPAVIESLVETIRGFAAEGTALLVVEQKLGVATALAERQPVMVGGQIAAETTSRSCRTIRTPSAATWASSQSPRRSEDGSRRRG